MVSIVKRGKSYRVFARGNNHRKSASFKIRAEALAWGLRTERELLSTKYGGIPKHTMREALQRYLEEEAPKKKGAREEAIRINKFMRELPFVDKPLQEIDSSDIAVWRDSRTTSPGTVRREMVALTSVFRVAISEWGWLEESPMASVRKPKSPRPRDKIFTEVEVKAVCDKLNGPLSSLVKMCFLLALETAMRSSELLSLTWMDVNLKTRVAVLRDTKNGDERRVPLSPKAVELFSAIPRSGDKVFGTLSSSMRDALFRKARDAAGVEGLTFHDARATALTRLARKVDVLTLAKISGHRDLKSLQVYYRESAEDIAKRLV